MNKPEQPDLTDLYDEVWFYPYPDRDGWEVAAPASSLPIPSRELDDLGPFEDDEF